MMPYQKFSALPLSLSLLALVAITLGGCSKPEAPPEPLRAVKVINVGTSSAQSGYEFSGEVKPRVESRLGFRVAGKMIRRQAELGQHVKAGDVLAQLDPQDYKLATDAARAQVAAASTNRDLAAGDFKRYAALREQNFISGAELERRETTLKAAQAQLQQAQAQFASQGNQARYTNLVADVSGVVTAIEAEPGQVVSAGTPVVRIAQDGARDVVFSVPEDKVAGVRPGAAVMVKPWASGTSVPGKVREVAASADPVTRTYAVKVSLDPAVQPPLGATVSVLPVLSRPELSAQMIKLPTSALRQEGKGTAVWVVDRGSMTLKSQPVQVTTADGNEAVISSGLQPGMTVVSAGVHVLQPGQKVAIWQDPSAMSAAAPAAPKPAPGTAAAAPVPTATR
ncbi:efflux RND transporter periplasmic adaptor subunit [Ramlibacter sp.]|uniref:efflux RND transporter periplasmic adaptor subunit n=1 Tax=Ramlibacter sp. TaxID=1917967 RepID=UPI0017C163F1|nr:efflux RND transporter periplasmic adaptor subunit [Ramlibacter sp.]MBA2674328.1 efflux RND transporter periplasmic adaptor subunit [Ramlibacter sp.]